MTSQHKYTPKIASHKGRAEPKGKYSRKSTRSKAIHYKPSWGNYDFVFSGEILGLVKG